MNPEMQNPQPGKATGIQVSEKHKNSIASKYSSIFEFEQSPQGKNNYSSEYHNTESDDLLEIAGHLLGCGEVDQ